jgi:tetratricopeptide (TPR) repeat protein
MRISEIRNTQEFQDLCQQLLAAEYEDFEILDDSSGDGGSDGYVLSNKRLFAIYCPEKFPPPVEYYKNKIRGDLKKAVALRNGGEYEIEEWVFITPAPLPPEAQKYLREKTREANLRGLTWSEKHLNNFLYKHEHLHPLFVDLITPNLQKGISNVQTGIESLSLQIENSFASLSIDKTSVVTEFEDKYKSRLEEQYERRFSEAKVYFEAKQFARAKDSYENIYHALEQDAEARNDKQLAKAATNVGICAWQLEETQTVIEWFERAFTHAPRDAKTVALKATALMYLGELDEALNVAEEALSINSDNDDAITAKANILLQANRFEELQDFLTQKGKENLSLFFLATELSAKKRREEAIDILRRLAEEEPENTQYLEHLASSLLGAVQERILSAHQFAWRTNTGDREQLEEAEGVLTRIIKLLKKTEFFPKLEGAYINRAAARAMMGKAKEAITDCNEVLRFAPASDSAYINRAKAEMQLGEYEAAAHSLEKYVELNDGNTGRATRDLIYSYFSSGQLDKAKELAERELTRDWSARDLDLVILAVHIFDKSFDAERAQEFISRAEQNFPNHSALYSLKARHEQNTGGNRIEEYLRKAFDTADATRIEQAKLDLADFYYDTKRYIEAEELYRDLISEYEFVPVNYKYLFCLYATSRFAEALEFAKKMRGEKEVDLSISPIEAVIQKTLGNVSIAAEIFRRLYELAPTNTDFLIEYGICLFRADETEKARQAFDQARNRVDKPKDLFALAYGYHFFGETVTAVELGYRALEQSPNDPESHLDYIKLVSNIKEGDGLVLGEKYAAAFQKSIETFNQRFPEQNEFKKYELTEDLSGFYELLDENETGGIDLIEHYRQRAIPAALIADVRGINIYLTWLGLRGDKSGFSVKQGTPEEYSAEKAAIAPGKIISVDLLALFTLTELKKADLLPKIFDCILVHQAIVDDLGNMIREMSGFAERGGTYSFGKTDGGYEVSHLMPEVYAQGAKFLEKVKEFVKTNCETTGFVRELHENESALVQTLGWAQASAVILARQKEIPLLSDDGILRHRMRAELALESFSNYTLFEFATGQKILSPNAFDDLNVQMLVDLNYRFIPIGARALMRCAEREGFRTRQKFDRALSLLGESGANIESMAMVLAQFIAHLWIEKDSWLLKRGLTKRVFRLIEPFYSSELKSRTLRCLYWELKFPPEIYNDIYYLLES